ncbi:MAG: transcription termination/antitermination protein NusG [Epulopiscium sp.]|nr:transcription termination/antitermination protein NusG [Candidatus Epulonipiscium sp.]
MSEEIKWYVVHTYSGYENKVKANIEKIVKNRNMQDQIHEVVVPLQDIMEEKNGKRKIVQKKVFPGYVLIKMHMNDDTWYVVRNTRGVTGFVGPGSKPVPLSEEEVRAMGIDMTSMKIDLEAGDSVKVVRGPFKDSIGIVKEVQESKQTVVVRLSMFGRETPVELDFDQIQKI